MEVHDIVQEAGIKTIPKKKKRKRAQWLSEEAVQTAMKREAKSKGEKEGYTHLNAEFQRLDHTLITWLSCTDHVVDHALKTKLIIRGSWDHACTDHVADHALIT